MQNLYLNDDAQLNDQLKNWQARYDNESPTDVPTKRRQVDKNMCRTSYERDFGDRDVVPLRPPQFVHAPVKTEGRLFLRLPIGRMREWRESKPKDKEVRHVQKALRSVVGVCQQYPACRMRSQTTDDFEFTTVHEVHRPPSPSMDPLTAYQSKIPLGECQQHIDDFNDRQAGRTPERRKNYSIIRKPLYGQDLLSDKPEGEREELKATQKPQTNDERRPKSALAANAKSRAIKMAANNTAYGDYTLHCFPSVGQTTTQGAHKVPTKEGIKRANRSTTRKPVGYQAGTEGVAVIPACPDPALMNMHKQRTRDGLEAAIKTNLKTIQSFKV